jgi:hypothetical protein
MLQNKQQAPAEQSKQAGQTGQTGQQQRGGQGGGRQQQDPQGGQRQNPKQQKANPTDGPTNEEWDTGNQKNESCGCAEPAQKQGARKRNAK